MAQYRNFLVMLKFVRGMAILFMAVNFDAVVHAEANGTIPSSGDDISTAVRKFRYRLLRRMIPGGAAFGLGHPPTR